MDNICHTLVGGALARAGFDRRTPLATATMMIGANFPDIDVVAVPLGSDIGFRRGITHGIPAHIVLPFVLTAIMLAWDRWVRRRKDKSLAPAIPKGILIAAAASIATHPFLDWCNSYGMRWLMPMRNEWFYGDSLFIVEPWLWVLLFFGYRLATTRRSTRPARVALGFAAAYIVGMMAVTLIVRAQIEREVGRGPLTRRALMVAPTALNPLGRQIVLADEGVYRIGRWSAATGLAWSDTIRINRSGRAVDQAVTRPELEDFLHWSRFPFFLVSTAPDGRRLAVQVSDARYSDRWGGGWASRTVFVEP